MKNVNNVIISPNPPASSNVGWVKTGGDKSILKFFINGKWESINGDSGVEDSATKVTWDANSNMDDFKTAGVYDIYGERTNKYDSIPITQSFNGASIAARLTVIASTLQPDNTEKCITQFLQLSNRMGGEGNTYIRTYNENNNGLTGWSPWKKLQGMVEYGVVTDEYGWGITDSPTGNAPDFGMNGFTENGMYSGIYTNDYTLQSPTFVETFVLVVINDYVVSSQAETPRRISQLKYATDTLTGQCTVKKRVGTGGDSISWSDWEEIGGSSEVDVTDAVKAYGLPTLVAQGLVKEGVTYKIYCSKSDFGSIILDNQNKLRAKIREDIINSPSWGKVLFNLHVIHNGSAHDDFLLITGKYFTDESSKDFVISDNFNIVQVSNMTKL